MEDFTPPKNKEEILQHISNITYNKRLQYAANIGRKCDNADELIKELRDVCIIYYYPQNPYHDSLHFR